MLLGLAIGTLHGRGSWSIRPWLIAIVLATLPFVLLAYVDMFHGVRGPEDWHLGIFENVRWLGSAAFVLSATALGLAVLWPRVRRAGWFALLLGLLVILGSGGRAALLCWLAVAVVMAWSVRRRRVLSLAAGALAVATAVTWVLHVVGALTTNDIFRRAVASTEAGDDLDQRAPGGSGSGGTGSPRPCSRPGSGQVRTPTAAATAASPSSTIPTTRRSRRSWSSGSSAARCSWPRSWSCWARPVARAPPCGWPARRTRTPS